jgi:hypothetical protein
VVIGKAANIPVSAPTPVVSVSPVVLSAPGRIIDLQMRVSAPTIGRDLPVIHYEYWNETGEVMIQVAMIRLMLRRLTKETTGVGVP